MDTAVTHEALQRARELEERGFRRAAIDVLEAELAQAPELGELWQKRAILLDREGRTAEAFDNIQRALVLSPLSVDGWLVLAQGYRRHGHRPSASSVYIDLANGDLSPDTWLAVHDGLSSVGRWYAALSLCRRMAQQRPDDDAVYFAMAHTLARLGRPPELSINVLRKAIGLNPAEPRYRASLAIQLLRIDRDEEAYACIAEMPLAAVESLSCRCCLQKILQLCIDSGDAARAAIVAGRLAKLKDASARSAKPAEGQS